MNKRLVVILALAALVWAGVTFITPPAKDKDPAASLAWPSSLDKALPLTVEVQGRALVLEQANGAFLARLPGSGQARRADEAKVRALLDYLTSHRPRRDLGAFDPAQAEAFGLKTPRLRVAASGEGAFDLTLGGANPAGDGLYALSSQARGNLLLVDAGYAQQLERPAESYLDLRLFDLKDDAVASVRLAPGREAPAGLDPSGLALERRKEDFAFAAPDGLKDVKTSGQAIRAWLRGLTAARAQGLEPAALPLARPEAGPALTVEIRPLEGPSQTLTLFKDAKRPKTWVGNSTFQPGRLRLDEEALRPLLARIHDLRDRSVLNLDTARVEQVTVVLGNRTVQARKAEAGWKDARTGADIMGIDMTLWRLVDLKSEGEAAAAAPKTAERTMSWQLADKDGKPLAQIEFLSDPTLPPGLCWVKAGDTGVHHQVPAQILKDLQGQLPALTEGN